MTKGSRWRRGRLAWGVAGAAVVTLAGAAWIWRLPLGEAAIRDAFERAGVDADFELTDAGLGGLKMRNVRLGPPNAPDAVASEAEARLRWGLLGPRLGGVRLIEPQLRVRIDQRGLSLGSLDALRGDGDAKAPSRLPDIRIDIDKGRILALTPAGAIPATLTASGRLTRDFAGQFEIAPISRKDDAGELRNLHAVVRARTVDGVLRMEADGGADAIIAPGFTAATFRVAGNAALPRDLNRMAATVDATALSLRVRETDINAIGFAANVAPAPDGRLSTRANVKARAITGPAIDVRAPDILVSATGDFRQATGEWSLRGADNRLGELTAAEIGASGDYTWDGRNADGAVIVGDGAVTLPAASMRPRGRADILRAIPNMGGSPVGPLIGSGKDALDRALQNFSTAANIKIDWRGGKGRIVLPGPLSLDAASGARVSVTPTVANRAVFAWHAPSGAIESSARIDMAGGGLPPATLTLARFSSGEGKMAAQGEARIAEWRGAGGRLDLSRTTFLLSRDGESGRFAMSGAVSLGGTTPSLSVTDFRTPLRIDAVWGGGFRVTLPDRCIDAATEGLRIPGHRFGARTVKLCTGADNVLVGADETGRMFGGFASEAVTLQGTTDDPAARPVAIATSRIVGQFVGPRGDSHLEIAAEQPHYIVDYAADRRIRFEGDVITARTETGGRIGGAFRGGVLEDPALPAHVTEIAGRWSAAPERGRTVTRISNGVARVTDKQIIAQGSATEEEPRPRFNPLRITNLSGALIDGDIIADGAIQLEAGARPLATFDARHALKTGEGRARVRNDALQFSRALDLYEVTELARGVVERVEGPVGVDLNVVWDRNELTSSGRISPKDVKLIATAIGPAEGISGDVDFDNLFALTTPPNQRLKVRRLNPGIVVEDGTVTFQILSPERILIEGAAWPFAAGQLAIDPQLVIIGEETFRMNLTLRDVDVQQLLAQLDFKDLTATGRVEGTFPLVFDATGGRIVDGELRASGEGGTISYTGNAGAGLVGAPQLAFEALKSFAYDNLVIELDGDLDGEVVTAIRFSGTNREPVGGIATGAVPLPGVERVKVAGVPFRFTVSVRAPFRDLARSSDSIRDPRSLINEAISEKEDTTDASKEPREPPSVDRPPSAPR